MTALFVLLQLGSDKSLDLFKENAADLIRMQATVDTLEWILRAAGIVRSPVPSAASEVRPQ